MTEHKFIIMSEYDLPMHFIIKVNENMNEPGNLQNISIHCTYQKKHYEIVKNENKRVIKNILIAFKSDENHSLSFKISNDIIEMVIVSELLDEPLNYVMKCTNNVQDMSRKQLEYKIVELEKRIDELQTEEYCIMEDMLSLKIMSDGSWLSDESNHKLFFEDLMNCQDNLSGAIDVINCLNMGKYTVHNLSIPLVHIFNQCKKTRSGCYTNCMLENGIGIENIYSKYELLYTDKFSKHDICIKGYLEISNQNESDEKVYKINLRYTPSDNIYTIFKKRIKPIYGKIYVTGNLLKYELFNSQVVKSKCGIKMPIDGSWIRLVNNGGINSMHKKILTKYESIHSDEYKKIQLN